MADNTNTSVARVALIVAGDEPSPFFYASVSDAELDMEAIDVRDGVYTAAYGPNGEPYSIGTEGERVIIRPTGEPPQPEKLRALILPYFDFIGEKPDDNISLASLLERCPPENIEGGPGIIAKLIIFGLPLLSIIGVIYALT